MPPSVAVAAPRSVSTCRPRRSAKRVYMRNRSPAKSAGFVAAGAGADLDDGVAIVVRIAAEPAARASSARSGVDLGGQPLARRPAPARRSRDRPSAAISRACASSLLQPREPIGRSHDRQRAGRVRGRATSAWPGSRAVAGSASSRATSSARASAWRSRASIGSGLAAVPSRASSAYLRRKRSTRPAVSIRRCLPVKYGWHWAQTST